MPSHYSNALLWSIPSGTGPGQSFLSTRGTLIGQRGERQRQKRQNVLFNRELQQADADLQQAAFEESKARIEQNKAYDDRLEEIFKGIDLSGGQDSINDQVIRGSQLAMMEASNYGVDPVDVETTLTGLMRAGFFSEEGLRQYQRIGVEPEKAKYQIVDGRVVKFGAGEPLVQEIPGQAEREEEKREFELKKTRAGKKQTDLERYLAASPKQRALMEKFKGLGAKADFKDVQSLRKEFSSLPEVKTFIEVSSQVARLDEAVKESKTSDSLIAVDQALITIFNKMLDPESVVRESEYARSPQDQAIMSRLKGKADRLLSGGVGLTPIERDALARMARRFGEISKKQFKEQSRFFGKEAERLGIKKERIIRIDPDVVLSGNTLVVPPDVTLQRKGVQPQQQQAKPIEFLGYEEE